MKMKLKQLKSNFNLKDYKKSEIKKTRINLDKLNTFVYNEVSDERIVMEEYFSQSILKNGDEEYALEDNTHLRHSQVENFNPKDCDTFACLVGWSTVIIELLEDENLIQYVKRVYPLAHFNNGTNCFSDFGLYVFGPEQSSSKDKALTRIQSALYLLEN